MSHYPSLCIPHVYKGINKKFIENMFRQFGILSNVEMHLKTSARGQPYYIVFIHFQMWYLDTYTYATRLRLMLGGTIQVHYSEKYFWKVSALREPTHPAPPKPLTEELVPRPPLHRPEPPKSLQLELPSLSSLSLNSPLSPPPIARPKPCSPLSSPPPSPSSPPDSPRSYQQQVLDTDETQLTYENCQLDYKNMPYPKRRRHVRYVKAA